MTQKSPPDVRDGDPRSRLIPVYTVIEEPRTRALSDRFSRSLVLEAVQEVLGRFRRDLGPHDEPPGIDAIVAAVEAVVLSAEIHRLRTVVNATGIILHTGLGRAVLPKRAVDALATLDRCCSMQIDLETGERGKRNYMTEQLLVRLTGAEAAVVVNNNAGATYLILAALCSGTEVIVSCGQLIEIGGSFRLPDCIRQSGATIVPVGTTNRTHLRDYEGALSENTGAILRASPSNYRVMGFTKEVAIAELVSLKKKRPVIVIDDLGCGALINLEKYDLPKELTVQDSVKAGADIVCFSGDKLIGGPQAGIIIGRKDLIQKIRKHPMTRMMRVCKLTDLALEQTLRMFLDEDTLLENHPTLRMMTASPKSLKAKAQALKEKIDADGLPLDVRVREGESATGGGSMPVTPLRTYVLAVRSKTHSLELLGRRLRMFDPPVITRIAEGDVLIDVRTLLPGEDEIVRAALAAVARENS